MDNTKALQILGSVAFRHPALVTVGTQLFNLYNGHKDEFGKLGGEYQQRAADVTTNLGQAAVALDLMKAHPNVSALVVQALGVLAPHIPELQKAIAQIQTELLLPEPQG